MSTDMAFDEIEPEEIKGLEATTTTVEPEGPLGLMNALNQIAANKKEGQSGDHYIRYVLNQQESFIRVDLKEPIAIWYCDKALRPAPPIIKEIITTFLAENGSTKDQFRDLYFQNERQVKLTASINGETLPLPSNPKAYAYQLLANATREKPAFALNNQASKIGFFAQGIAKPDANQKTLENDQEQKPKTPGRGGTV